MLIYILIILWVFFYAILSIDKNIKVYDKTFFLFVLLLLIPIAGLRYKIGVDYDSYLFHYELTPDIFNYTRTFSSMEIGYEIIVSLFKTINFPFYVLTLTITTITFFLFYHLAIHYSPYPTLSLLMFFSFAFWGQVMGQMRQPLAIFILYLFLFLLENEKRIKFLIVIIATSLLFHKANIFFIFPLFLINHKLKNIHYWCILIMSIIIGFFLSPIIVSSLSFLPGNLPFKDSLIMYIRNNNNPVIFTLGMIERIILFLIISYLCEKHNLLNQDKKLQLLYNMYFFGICLYFLFIHISSDFGARGSFCLTFSMFFLFPRILKALPNKKEYTFFLIIILLWSLYMSADIFTRGEIYIPYKSILYE